MGEKERGWVESKTVGFSKENLIYQQGSSFHLLFFYHGHPPAFDELAVGTWDDPRLGVVAGDGLDEEKFLTLETAFFWLLVFRAVARP